MKPVSSLSYVLALLVAVALIAGCKKKVKRVVTPKHYNQGAQHHRIRALADSLRSRYKIQTRKQAYMRGGTPYMERGITEENFWFFTQRRDKKQKTRRHFTRRFSITRQRYRSLHAAHRAFTLRYEKYSQSSPMETKGDVSFTILTGTSVYLISADCLMGNHLTAVFTMFTRTVLAGHDPEPGSLLKHMCGGTFRLL